ncbi:MAG: acyl-CoA dehydrogenase [Stellaceae bacterium]
MPYAAPLAEMRFVLDAVAGSAELSADILGPVLGEAARLAESVIAPLNQPADRVGSVLENGVVRTPAGFREAYARYVEGGWNGLSADPEYGGQGLPLLLAAPVGEMWNSACMSFALCPLLNLAAVEVLQRHGSDAQKQLYLAKLVSGEWTGTMNLTEPQAGSDLGPLRTRAVPAQGSGWGDSYRITGQKIFITWGDHDLAPNIVHMVLARIAGGPSGSRGLSLFLVPKYLPDENGAPGRRNGVRTLSLEHKLGIHGSPTCVLDYEDATGWLVGAEHRGLEAMFVMMNNARLNVGLQGVAIAERAYQEARDFARTRVQGHPIGAAADAGALAIIHHPDVRRMLLWMRAGTQAMRALAYYAVALVEGDAAARRRAELLTPVVKAWCSDLAVAIASTGIQVHGGMGYIEETGAAQYLRDARIAPIYEGTNGIQAGDLVGRKLRHDRGMAAAELFADIETTIVALDRPHPHLAGVGAELRRGLAALRAATSDLVGAAEDRAAAGAAPYLEIFGIVASGWLIARQALAADRQITVGDGDALFLAAKIQTARFFAEHFLARAPGCLAAALGGGTVLAFDPDRL